MTATVDLVRLEVRPTRRVRIVLERFAPGAILAALHPAVSFFYRVTENGEMKACTPDPVAAREAFREACRWAAKA